jgi:mannose-6-phosphate isomerase-like protein (cupin superfamily)
MEARHLGNVARELEAGGYEILSSTPGLELGVYELRAPEPDRQEPHADDELYVVLEGSGALDVDGERLPAEKGDALFVGAGVPHRFVDYEQITLLVVFARPQP